MKRFITILATVVFCTSIGGINAYAEEIKVGAGAGAPTENVLKPVKGPFEKATGIKLIIVPSGVKNSLTDLERGAVDAAAAGLSFQDWMNFMKKEGSEVKNPASLNPVTIGKDRIAVIAHKENPVKKLSKEQLKGIFTGGINNWKDVGGIDSPILVVWGQLMQGTNTTFIKQILDGKPQTDEVLAVTTADEVKQTVISNPPAIGIGPMAIVDNTVNAFDTPEVSRDITLLTKGKPSPQVQKLLDFIKGEGQKYVKQ